MEKRLVAFVRTSFLKEGWKKGCANVTVLLPKRPSKLYSKVLITLYGIHTKNRK
jgi:hypothetical protein